jgi:hypothetical protein
LYQNRLAGTAPRPPVTLIQQNEFIHNVNVNKQVQIGNKTIKVTDPQSILKHMPVAAPLNKIEQKQFKLVPISKTTAVAERKAAQHVAAVAVERHQREAKLITQGVHPAKPTDPPARVKVVQPKGTTPSRITHVAAPTPPVVPKHVEQPIPKHVPVQPIHVNPPQPKGKDKGKGKGSGQLHREMFQATQAVMSVSENRPRRFHYVVAATLGNSRTIAIHDETMAV